MLDHIPVAPETVKLEFPSSRVQKKDYDKEMNTYLMVRFKEGDWYPATKPEDYVEDKGCILFEVKHLDYTRAKRYAQVFYYSKIKPLLLQASSM